MACLLERLTMKARAGGVASFSSSSTAPPSDAPHCDNRGCFEPISTRCQWCLAVSYCGKDCQQAHWTTTHHNVCVGLARSSLMDLIKSRWRGDMGQLLSWLTGIKQELLVDRELQPPAELTPDLLKVLATLSRTLRKESLDHATLCMTVFAVYALEASRLTGSLDNAARQGLVRNLQALITELQGELGQGSELMVHAYMACGRLLVRLNRFKDATEFGKLVVEQLEPLDVEVPLMVSLYDECLTWFLKEDHVVEASTGAEIAQRAVNFTKERAEVSEEMKYRFTRALVVLLLERKAYSQCLAVAQSAIEDFGPMSTIMSVYLSKSLVCLGRLMEAEATARLGIALLNRHPVETVAVSLIRLHFILAEAMAYRNAFGDAHASFNTALKLINCCSPTDPMVKDLLLSLPEVTTMIFEEAGLFQDAVRFDDMIAQVLPEVKHEPDAIRRAAICAMEAGQMDRAEGLLLGVMKAYKAWDDGALVFAVPDYRLDSMRRALKLLAAVLEQRGQPSGLVLAENIRQELQEHAALEMALGVNTLVGGREQREAARRRRRSRRKEPEAASERGMVAAYGGEMASPTQQGGEEDQEPCTICCLPIDMSVENVSLLPCSHRFHDECLMAWVARSNARRKAPTCPLCRAEIKK